MQIKNHLLVGTAYAPSPNIGGILNPTYVVMHYTAGWNAASAVNNFKNKASKVSAHVVVERDGTITQCVPFNRVAWHAGPSIYDGHNGMNNFSIGIEIVNIGFLREKPGAPGVYQMSSGSAWSDVPADRLKDFDLSVRAPNARVGGGNYIWPAYTAKQIAAVKDLFAALLATYKIKDVTGHETIDTRHWKTDPGPAFPMTVFKDMVHGTPDAAPAGRNDGQEHHGTAHAAVSVNVRRSPSTTAGIVHVLTKGDMVATVKEYGDWTLVEYAAGAQGYVSTKYLAAA